MKFDSPLFDSVRVKPGKDRRPKTGGPACQWSGCKEKASHRAPKGRENEKDYWRFCLEHVRQYNQSYNFFKGMNDAAVMAYQKDAITGHRPTWKMGTGKAHARADFRGIGSGGDPFSLFGEGLRGEQQARARHRRHPAPSEDALQGTGEAVSSRRQWRRSLDRGSAGRGHPIVQLPEIGRVRLNEGHGWIGSNDLSHDFGTGAGR